MYRLCNDREYVYYVNASFMYFEIFSLKRSCNDKSSSSTLIVVVEKGTDIITIIIQNFLHVHEMDCECIVTMTTL